jgi:TatD DNase family protein
MTYQYFDVHSHISGEEFDADRDEVVRDMEANGVGTITVGSDLASSKLALACAQKYRNIFASVGLHPHEVNREVFDENAYKDLIADPRTVAVGECGLDYHHPQFPIEDQRGPWLRHLELAVAFDKPLMLHGRPSKGAMDAYDDMIKDLMGVKQRHGDHLRGNVHFFVGNPEIAQRFFDLGFTISFSGVITFTHDYDATVQAAPLSLIHAETDSPYATPIPFRGARNDPRRVSQVVVRIAEIKQMSVGEVAKNLVLNAERFFRVGV